MHERNRRKEIQGVRYSAQKYRPAKKNLGEMTSTLSSIYTLAFPHISITSRQIQNIITNPLGSTILLKKDDSEIIGFSIAVPLRQRILDINSTSTEAENPHLITAKKRRDISNTAYVYYTVITPQDQKKGLVGIIMSSMQEELKKSGYTHIERDVVAENGYADKIRKHYEKNIEYESPEFKSAFGPLVHFRIRL